MLEQIQKGAEHMTKKLIQAAYYTAPCSFSPEYIAEERQV